MLETAPVTITGRYHIDCWISCFAYRRWYVEDTSVSADSILPWQRPVLQLPDPVPVNNSSWRRVNNKATIEKDVKDEICDDSEETRNSPQKIRPENYHKIAGQGHGHQWA